MNKFRKIVVFILLIELLVIVVANLFALNGQQQASRQYRVEVERVSNSLRNGEDVNLDSYPHIVSVKPYTQDYRTNNDYKVITVDRSLLAIEYKVENQSNNTLYMNVGLCVMFVITAGVLFYVEQKVLKPFHNMSNLSVELAKGNLSAPIKEEKSKFFGKFLWGMDMLRDNLESNKKKELELQKEKKTLILSISHDIKTPLSAIKLYTKALSENLYDTEEKRSEALDGIARNTVEIEKYVSDIVTASKEDFLNLEANVGEYYLSDVIDTIDEYYSEKFQFLHTEFSIENYENCLLSCDRDRLVEVLQNALENAIKYGDGKRVKIAFDEEEDCKLISITNSGCSLDENEIPHLFESFYRGSNVGVKEGSGLGLYIAKSLMRLMDGDIFASVDGDEFSVVVVVRKV